MPPKKTNQAAPQPQPEPEAPNPAVAAPPDTPPVAAGPPEEKPAETPPEPKAPAPELTEEQLEEGRAAFMAKMGFGPQPKPPEKPNEPEKEDEPAPEEKAPEPKPEDKPEEREEEEPETPAPAQTHDLERLADETARRVTDRLAKQPPPEPAKPQPKPDERPALSPGRRAKLEAAQYLEKNSDTYRGTGLSDQMRRFFEAEDAYKTKWLKDNPGKRYESNAADHDEWYTSHEPTIDESDLEDAKVAVAEQREQEREERHKKELEEIRLANERDRQRGEVDKVVDDCISTLYAETDPAVKEAVTVGGRLVVNEETEEKVKEADPLLHAMLGRHKERVKVLITELEHAARFGGSDPSKVVTLSSGEEMRPMEQIQKFANALEEIFMNAPEKERTSKTGQKFIPYDQYWDRVDEIKATPGLGKAEKQRLLAAHKQRYWCIDSDLIKTELVRSAARRARDEAEHYRGLVQKTSKSGNNSETQKGSTRTPPPTPAPPASSGSNRPPPAITSGSERTNPLKTNDNNDQEKGTVIDRVMGW